MYAGKLVREERVVQFDIAPDGDGDEGDGGVVLSSAREGPCCAEQIAVPGIGADESTVHFPRARVWCLGAV